MWPCWASRQLQRARAPRWPGRSGFLALPGILLLVVLPSFAQARSYPARIVGNARDSGRVVRGVVIGEEGIRITGDDSLDVRADGGSGGVNATVDVNGERHHLRVRPRGVDVGANGQNVRVMGPIVQVDGTDTDMVRVFADAEVPPGERIEGDVVAVFGSVTVHGEVTGSAVAVFGSVMLDSTARVEGDAVAVGGSLDAAHGSSVGGQSISLGFLPIAWGMPALPIVIGFVMTAWASSLFLGWLLHVLFADRMMRAAVTASRRTGLSFLVGLASAPLMVIGCVLLLITVLGIPLALLLPIAYWLLTWAGQLAASYVLGSRLMRRGLTERWSFAPLALGTLFVAGFFIVGALLAGGVGFVRTGAVFFDLLGILMLLGLTVIGTGAFLVSRLGAQPSDLFARPRVSSGGVMPQAPAVPLVAPVGSVTPPAAPSA